MPHEHRPPDETYAHAATAARLGKLMARVKQSPLPWAQEMHRQWQQGLLAPKKTTDPKTEAKIRSSMQTVLQARALNTVVRGENEQRLRSLIRAVRLLAASKDKADRNAATQMGTFLGEVWGVTCAADVIAEGDIDDQNTLRSQWGHAQLPPTGATVNQWVADELLISAAVRRLG